MDSDSCRQKRTIFPLLFLVFCLSTPIFLRAAISHEHALYLADKLIEEHDEIVKARLATMDQSLLEHRYDTDVRNVIAFYLRYPRDMGIRIGRTVSYFPIIEQELAAAGVPEMLKYLPIIESALRPQALSPVGALGMWQFMPATAREYGLRIDDMVDERIEPVAATRAAARYLQGAYDYLGDWSLAIASYNAGRGGVKRVMNKTGGTNYWEIKKQLPKETRFYVPSFIAAVYLCEYFGQHDIKPVLPSLEKQLVAALHVDKPLSFYKIAHLTGLSVDFIQDLNPAYKMGYLPGYEGGHDLILPERVMPALKDYLDHWATDEDATPMPWALNKPLQMPVYQPNDDRDYEEKTLACSEGDTLRGVADQLQISVSRLSAWNLRSSRDTLHSGEVLRYFRPANYAALPKREVKLIDNICSFEPYAHFEMPLPAPSDALPSALRDQWCVCINKKDNAETLAAQFPGIDLDDVLLEHGLPLNKSFGRDAIICMDKPDRKE